MLIAIIAAAMVVGDAGPRSGLTGPSPADIAAAWPANVPARARQAEVVLRCAVDRWGRLRQCGVRSESPPGMGFGTAALSLAVRFQLPPTSRPKGGWIDVPIRFAPISEGVILNSEWIAAPRFADVGRAYPAAGGGGSGHVELRCRLRRDGLADRCKTNAETPAGKGFAEAAQSLVSLFRARPDRGTFPGLGSTEITIPFTLPDPHGESFQNRGIGNPVWVIGPDPATTQKLFPAAAAARGMTTGKGVAECRVLSDGTLADCRPLPGDPDGMGFSEAAVQVARIMRMSPWTQDGGPIDGADIRVPIRFNLAPDTPNPPAKGVTR